MRMNEFVTRADLGDVIHSSGYAKSQSGERIGAAGASQSFSQRREIDRNRTVIRAYADSKIARQNFSRHGEISKVAKSSLEAIRERRAEREAQSPASARRDFSAGNSNLRARQNSSKFAKKPISEISQSGVIGAQNFSAQKSAASNFHQIKPKIGF